MTNSKWLQIGVVGKPKGSQGEFFLVGRDEPLAVFYPEFVLGPNPSLGIPSKIKNIKDENGLSVVQMTAFSSAEQVVDHKGTQVWVKRSTVPLEEDEFLFSDLIGRSIRDMQGQEVAKITNAYNVGANNNFTVTNLKGVSTDLPFISQYFDTDFDSESDFIQLIVDWGIFEEMFEG